MERDTATHEEDVCCGGCPDGRGRRQEKERLDGLARIEGGGVEGQETLAWRTISVRKRVTHWNT